MKHFPIYLIIALLLWGCSKSEGNNQDERQNAAIPVMETGGRKMPNRWIDKTTGHEIVRLTRREGDNRSFYFTNNPFLPAKDGKGSLMVFHGSTDHGSQLFTVNLQNYQINQITHRQGRVGGEIVGTKKREVFFQSHDSVFAVNVDSHETKLIYVFPKDFQGHISTLNSNEELLAGVYSSREALRKVLDKYPSKPRNKEDWMYRTMEAHIKHTLFTININTGKLKKIHHENNWLNHLQFSPTDPNLLMFAHEGIWELVDRTWLLNLNTGKTRLMHKRTVKMEINGHESWQPDGKKIWFDLQIPRGATFYLAGVDIDSGHETRYAMKRNEWSIHFTISPNEKLFAGDGGDPTQVAKAPDGMWIYLFHPDGDSLHAEKLVNMQHQDYRALEPNVHFSPDGKWVIFRANFEGKDEAYAVRIAKSNV